MSIKDWVLKTVKYNPYITICDGISIIGYGRNLNDEGISKTEALLLFDNDFNRIERELSPFMWYFRQPENIQHALINLCFHMGLNNLLSFKNMRKAIIKGDYTHAAIELLNSSWSAKHEELAKDIAIKIREG